jgi:hypothetical protein
MYVIVWKYKVKPACSERFEHEYGKQGSWSVFFGDSDKYIGSFLCKSDEEPEVYLLVDKWKDQISYNDFMRIKSAIYEQLNRQFESLYESEEKIGDFTDM